MAARLLMGQRAAAQLTAGLLVGSVAFYPATAHAEAPPHPRKSIYDDFEDSSPPAPKTPAFIPNSATPPAFAEPAQQQQQVVARGPTPTDQLAAQIRRARLFLHRQAAVAEDGVNAAMDRAFDLEQSFTSTLASLAPSRESGERLMPGLVYVLVASMAGSIVSRRRNVVFRAAAPIAFGVAAGWAVLPVTMRNVGDLAWRYEQRFPVVADAHLRTREGAERGISFAKVHWRLGTQMVGDKVAETRETLEGWVRKGK
ncbi:hypothetical protein MGG_00488 [Pyricularia oryzae 70-15]|uniref:MICOS complex subunit n=1 Tax=Pyricularia oryzae (strain 70-15 / ATCC MYA-4617 / FGSC 8958) TaxID=242507 RepID=G4NBT2_PYRO7|nr:uncharacterized protein MGG_00488 [Pyricularia oryzae 70-15]EHA48990.1 hypothetical protein MGG_00488 [Pyricularia oryzae 70-15]KAI7929376.1 hypothetical protein M9X92_001264 [Pyricularia oryzae]